MSALHRVARAWVLAALIVATLIGLVLFWSRPEHRVAIMSVPAAHDVPHGSTSCPTGSVPSVDAAGTDVGAPLLPSAAPSPAVDDAGAADVPADGLEDSTDAVRGAASPSFVGSC